jgi:hypothetical protein
MTATERRLSGVVNDTTSSSAACPKAKPSAAFAPSVA